MNTRSNLKYGVAFVLVAAVTGWYAYQRDLPGQYRDYQDSETHVDGLRERSQHVEAERSRLQERVENLGSDQVEMEASIRRNEGLVRPGEKVVRVELPDSETAPSDR
jgi:cell division protein FtsB